MKTKNWKIWTGVVATLIAMMNLVPMVSAAETAGITVTVTVSYLSFNLSSSTVAFGTIRNGTMVNNTVTVGNDGNWNISLTLKQTPTNNWTANTTIGANTNTYALAGRFNATSVTDPVPPSNNDIITTTAVMANSTIFGGDGNNIPVNGFKKLWLFFNAPTSTTFKTEQTITVTVGAVAA